MLIINTTFLFYPEMNESHNLQPSGAFNKSDHTTNLAVNQPTGHIPANNEIDKMDDLSPSHTNHPNDFSRVNTPLQIVKVGELSYQEITIKIYADGAIEKNNNSSPRFFFEPIVLLDPKSITIQSQELFKEDVVRFTIQMWTPKIRSKVLELLRLDNAELREKDVSVMPYEDVQLVGKLENIQQSIKIMEDSTPYHRLNESLDFFFLCDSPSTAKILADNLRSYPNFVLRKWHLALECRGMTLDSPITNYERPLFKLVVSTFPTAYQGIK